MDQARGRIQTALGVHSTFEPVPPQADPNDRIVNDVHRFVVAKLKEAGLKQSPEADRETLINRVSLTLTAPLRHSKKWMRS